MTAEFIEYDEPSAGSERATWQAPQVTRFGAAGASAGETSVNSADGETAKS